MSSFHRSAWRQPLACCSALLPRLLNTSFFPPNLWNVPRGNKPGSKDLDPEVGRQRGQETLGQRASELGNVSCSVGLEILISLVHFPGASQTFAQASGDVCTMGLYRKVLATGAIQEQ